MKNSFIRRGEIYKSSPFLFLLLLFPFEMIISFVAADEKEDYGPSSQIID